MRRKVKRPTKKELQEAYDRLGSITNVAIFFGVSAWFVRSWFNKYGIKTYEQRAKEAQYDK